MRTLPQFICRVSSHIQDDLGRSWSSWNYGQDGIFATEDQIESWKNEAIANDDTFGISGFELYGKDILNADIRELYAGYWVLVDDNFSGCLAATPLQATTLKGAITEGEERRFSDDGFGFSPEDYKLVASIDDMHIFELV